MYYLLVHVSTYVGHLHGIVKYYYYLGKRNNNNNNNNVLSASTTCFELHGSSSGSCKMERCS